MAMSSKKWHIIIESSDKPKKSRLGTAEAESDWCHMDGSIGAVCKR